MFISLCDVVNDLCATKLPPPTRQLQKDQTEPAVSLPSTMSRIVNVRYYIVTMFSSAAAAAGWRCSAGWPVQPIGTKSKGQ